MRTIFGVMSLLVVLAIVGTLGKKQLHALGQMGGVAGAAPAIVEGTVSMQAQAIQNKVRDATNAALQKGADRNQGAPP